MSKRSQRPPAPVRHNPQQPVQTDAPKDGGLVTESFSIEERYSGPLAHPYHVRMWQQMVPDAPERILRMGENQQAHRIKIEGRVIQSNITAQERGQVFSAGILALTILCSTYLIATGHSVEGLAGVVTALGAGAGVAIWNRRSQQEERRERRRELPRPAQPRKQG